MSSFIDPATRARATAAGQNAIQSLEGMLHAPMPFGTSGQTISDRLNAAKHSIAGSQLGKTICKATTEELMGPKKKHLDYLLHCTHEPNVSIPQMANLLIERVHNPNWCVCFKALITLHNLMCYGNERFSQYLASCNAKLDAGAFMDKAGGFDMWPHIRRYAAYITEKITSYRVMAFDFCKVKRGRDDGLLRTMAIDNLLKTLPVLQNQMDALTSSKVSPSDLNNGVINAAFILLFRDLIRLFACYNDGIINMLEKFFDMTNRKQCRDSLTTYKVFLKRMDKVEDFLKVAETIGIDKGEIPNLTRAPQKLLDSLEAHLAALEGRPVGSVMSPVEATSKFDAEPEDREKYIEEERRRLETMKMSRENSLQQTGTFNPFGASSQPTHHQSPSPARPPPPAAKQQDDPMGNPFNPFGGAPSQPANNPFSAAPNTQPGNSALPRPTTSSTGQSASTAMTNQELVDLFAQPSTTLPTFAKTTVPPTMTYNNVYNGMYQNAAPNYNTVFNPVMPPSYQTPMMTNSYPSYQAPATVNNFADFDVPAQNGHSGAMANGFHQLNLSTPYVSTSHSLQPSPNPLLTSLAVQSAANNTSIGNSLDDSLANLAANLGVERKSYASNTKPVQWK